MIGVVLFLGVVLSENRTGCPVGSFGVVDALAGVGTHHDVSSSCEKLLTSLIRLNAVADLEHRGAHRGVLAIEQVLLRRVLLLDVVHRVFPNTSRTAGVWIAVPVRSLAVDDEACNCALQRLAGEQLPASIDQPAIGGDVDTEAVDDRQRLRLPVRDRDDRCSRRNHRRRPRVANVFGVLLRLRIAAIWFRRRLPKVTSVHQVSGAHVVTQVGVGEFRMHGDEHHAIAFDRLPPIRDKALVRSELDRCVDLVHCDAVGYARVAFVADRRNAVITHPSRRGFRKCVVDSPRRRHLLNMRRSHRMEHVIDVTRFALPGVRHVLADRGEEEYQGRYFANRYHDAEELVLQQSGAELQQTD